MFRRLLFAAALLLATIAAPAAFAGQHHTFAGSIQPPIESAALESGLVNS